jgi:SprT protein
MPIKNYTVPFALREKTAEKIEECLEIATDMYPNRGPGGMSPNSWAFPEVRYDVRGKTAGYANSTRNRIRLNAELLIRYKDVFINRTVVHEVAHIIAYWVFGPKIRPHGNEWKRVMRLLGIANPTRCHSYEVTPARKTRTVKAACDCRTIDLGIIRARRIKKGCRYSCRKCSGKIRLIR